MKALEKGYPEARVRGTVARKPRRSRAAAATAVVRGTGTTCTTGRLWWHRPCIQGRIGTSVERGSRPRHRQPHGVTDEKSHAFVRVPDE